MGLPDMAEVIVPAKALGGLVSLPGDKSISHRYAMISALAEGTSTIRNYASGADCRSTLGCLRALGVPVQQDGSTVVIEGSGLRGLRQPAATLDAGNSGSTIRMLSGILAAQTFASRIEGDESLAKRPMQRVMKPLAEMGARITAHEGKFPPLEIQGGPLRPIDYTPLVASAQVKTCVLFAGLFAEGETIVRESVITRDHTEIALREFGADIETVGAAVHLRGPAKLTAREVTVPGDLSSAAFFLVAAQLVPGAEINIQNVGLNPTRAGLLDYLRMIGADIRVLRIEERNGELVGDLRVRYSKIGTGEISGSLTATVIDEIPVLGVLGAARGGLVVKDAAELRVKETDRIATLAENFRRMGIAIEVAADGFRVPGNQQFQAAACDSFGDHRIAMACSVAALAAAGPVTIENPEAASVSYPEFYETLRELARTT